MQSNTGTLLSVTTGRNVACTNFCLLCLLFHCSTPTNRRSRDLNQDPTEGGEAAIHLVLSWLGYLVDNECCDDGLKLWRDDDGARPDIDLTRVLVEEEYVLNEHQTALACQLLATPFYFP